MNDDYLWDRSGKPDPEIERLENLLGRFRHDQPAPQFPAIEPQRRRSWISAWMSTPRLAFAAASLALLMAGSGYAWRWMRPAWEVARVEGAPRVGTSTIRTTGRLGVGEWLETDSGSRAKIAVGMIGEVEVDPNTRIGLLRARSTEHRLSLARGTMHATIWAPPRFFSVDTPSAVAVDLGCKYTLRVEPDGSGLLHVTYGWVAFEQRMNGAKVESFVPAGAMAMTQPGIGPGTPYFEDASAGLRQALFLFDFGGRGDAAPVMPEGASTPTPAEARASALSTVLVEARQKDALTLWHLLARTTGAERAEVSDRLAQLVPPPAGVTRDGVLAGDAHMRDLWWDALGLGDTSWWRMWRGPVPAR